MRTRSSLLAMLLVVAPAASAAADPGADLTATVTAMARIGRAVGGTFSPDGSRLAVISDLNGTPQIWVVSAAGGWPSLVTTSQDPVGAVEWSPAGDWIAFTVLPGGGLNSQVYVARPDGTGLRRLTDGGRENNWLSRWTWDGRQIVISSNRRDPASMDAWLIDVATGTFREIARNPWMAAISTIEYGDPATQADILASLSPIHKLRSISAAMMVLHGANDTNVPVVGAEQIVEHLRSRDVPVEYILFPDEGHGWRKVPNRIRSAVAITEFFVKHLAASSPKSPAAASAQP